jgi:hypothetical protein
MEIYLIKDGDLVCVDQEITATVFESEGYIRYAKDSSQVKKLLDAEYAVRRIAELKLLLSTTDWKVIVNAELVQAGLPPKYPNLHAERQAWRDEINELEQV